MADDPILLGPPGDQEEFRESWWEGFGWANHTRNLFRALAKTAEMLSYYAGYIVSAAGGGAATEARGYRDQAKAYRDQAAALALVPGTPLDAVSRTAGVGAADPLMLLRGVDLPAPAITVWAIEKAASWTLTADDAGRVFFVVAGEVTATLPGAGDEGMTNGWHCRVVPVAGDVTIAAAGADVVDAAATAVVTSTVDLHRVSATSFRSA